MRLILDLDAPDAGSVTVGGQPYTSCRCPLFQAGALLEAKAFHGGRTAHNHLLCLALSNGISRARTGKVLDLVGLAGAARRRAGVFSLGISQRLGIAAALLGDPPVLMLDEPVSGLDPGGMVWIRTLLKSLAAEGRTVLLSSHLMSEMALTADQLIIVGRGRLIIQATMEDFLAGGSGGSGGSGGYIRVRSPQAAELAALLTARGATVARRDGDALTVTGISTEAIGEVAVASRLTRPRAARIRSRRRHPLQRRRRPARNSVRALPARGAAAAILAGHPRAPTSRRTPASPPTPSSTSTRPMPSSPGPASACSASTRRPPSPPGSS